MNIFTYFKKHAFLASGIAIIAVIVMVIAGRVAARKDAGQAGTETGLRQVSLVDASAFRKDASTVFANGTVESVAQADLKSQVSAPVSYISVSIGSSVAAGQVILELKNADIRARLDQAKAALASAQGGYQTGAVSLASARVKAADESKNAYSAVDQAIRGQIDQFLFNSSGGEQPLVSHVSDIQIIDKLHSTRDDLSNLFMTWKSRLDALSPSSSDVDLQEALSQSKSVLAVATSLLDTISVALNTASRDSEASFASTVNAWKAIVNGAKTSLTASASVITATDTALKNSLSSQGTTAEAGIRSAEAGVASLEAELAKTIIASPISGRVASLPLRVGELASPGTLLATVVGGGGLQVKAFASGEDLSRIVKGAPAILQNGLAGTVSAVSPSVSETNRKVEVTISIADSSQSKLIVGQTVSVSIHAAKSEDSVSSAPYFLPIQDIKIVPGDAYVFTVNADSKVVRHSVVLGSVEGDFVEVQSGIEDGMELVSPVYELEEGQTVDVR